MRTADTVLIYIYAVIKAADISGTENRNQDQKLISKDRLECIRLSYFEKLAAYVHLCLKYCHFIIIMYLIL